MSDTVKHEAPNPAPQLQLVDSPDGDGQIGLYQTEPGKYKVHHAPGNKRRVRRHVFHDLGGFALFVKRHAPNTADVILDEDTVTADFHPAVPSADVVTCQLQHSTRFVPWRDAFPRRLDQKGLQALLRAQKADITDPRIADALLVATRKLSVSGTQNLTSEVDERGYQRFRGESGSRKIDDEIPPVFEIAVPILEGIRAVLVPGLPAVPLPIGEQPPELTYHIEVFLWADIGEGKVTFTLTAPSLPAVLLQARRDAATYLQSLLGEGFLVHLGEFSAEEAPAYEMGLT